MVARTAKQAYVLAREAGSQQLETSALAALARAHLAAKRPEEALSVAKEAVSGANAFGERKGQLLALQVLADVSVKLGRGL